MQEDDLGAYARCVRTALLEDLVSLPPAACEVNAPQNRSQRSDGGEDAQLVTAKLPEKSLGRFSEEVSQVRHGRGPNPGSDQVQHQVASGRDVAHPDREGGYGPEPIEEAEPEDEGKVMAFDQALNAFHLGSPGHPSSQEGFALPPPEMEVELVSEEAPRERGQHHQRERQVAAVGREAREHENGLALQKGAHHQGHVAVGVEELGQAQRVASRSR